MIRESMMNTFKTHNLYFVTRIDTIVHRKIIITFPKKFEKIAIFK